MAPTRALIAARKSTKVKQVDGGKRIEGMSLDDQDNYSQEFCERMAWVVVGVARDTISGRVAPVDRKDLGSWLSDPNKLALFDVIVAYKSDRFSRGEDTDWSRIETWAADNKKTLVMVDSATGIHYPSRHDGDFWQWTGAKREASKEWNAIRERIQRSKRSISAAGGFVGNPPWEYVIVGQKYQKTIVPTETAKKYVPLMADKCIAGESADDIARWLSIELGRKITQRLVLGILHNATYMGHYVDTGLKVIHKCEPVIDAAKFQRVQRSLANREPRGRNKSVENPAFLKNVAYCPDCGGDVPMQRNGSRKVLADGTEKDFHYYRCVGKRPHRKGCGNMIRVEVADKIIDSAMSGWTTETYEIKVVHGTDWLAEIEELKFRITHLDQEADDYDDTHAALRAQLKELRTREVVPDTIEKVKSGVTFGDRWKTLDLAGKRKFLADEKVKVYLSKQDILQTFPLDVMSYADEGNVINGYTGGKTGIYWVLALPDYEALSR
jgi:site-specific DNA recombinase